MDKRGYFYNSLHFLELLCHFHPNNDSFINDHPYYTIKTLFLSGYFFNKNDE